MTKQNLLNRDIIIKCESQEEQNNARKYLDGIIKQGYWSLFPQDNFNIYIWTDLTGNYCYYTNCHTNKSEYEFVTLKELTGVLDIKSLILNSGLTIQSLIDTVIEINGIIGVGLITLGDQLRDYCHNKIKKQ